MAGPNGSGVGLACVGVVVAWSENEAARFRLGCHKGALGRCVVCRRLGLRTAAFLLHLHLVITPPPSPPGPYNFPCCLLLARPCICPHTNLTLFVLSTPSRLFSLTVL